MLCPQARSTRTNHKVDKVGIRKGEREGRKPTFIEYQLRAKTMLHVSNDFCQTVSK